MKSLHLILVVLVVLVTTCAGWAAPQLPKPVPDQTVAPYANAGLIYSSRAQGSASVYYNPRILVTAGHVFTTRGGVVDTSGAEFFLQYHSSTAPARGTGTPIARLILFGGTNGYSAMVSNYGINSNEAFDVDVAVGYSYSDLNGGNYSPATRTPYSYLRGQETKTILGYAAVLYEAGPYASNSATRYWLHEAGPGTTAFSRVPDTEDFYEATTNNAYATPLNVVSGMSGGPVMGVDASGVWFTVAIIVAAPASYYFAPFESTGPASVRVLGSDVMDTLVSEAMMDLGATGTLALPGFETLWQIDSSTYYSQELGYLAFSTPVEPGYGTAAAWSVWLNSAVTTNGTLLWNPDYGSVTLSGAAQLIGTSSLGDVYVGPYGAWAYSTRVGWVSSAKTGAPEYFYSASYGWLYADNVGGIYSYALGEWL